MQTRGLSSLLTVVALLFSSSMAFGQAAETEGGWTSISFMGGLSSGSSDTGVALGGTFVYELSPWLALEAAGHYLDRGSGADAFDLSGNLLVSLVPSSRELVPYLTAGGGLYRASYDLDHRRFLGPMAGLLGPGGSFPGGGMPHLDPFGMMPDLDDVPYGSFFGEMPQFYMNRLGNVVIPANGLLGTRSFSDPAVNFGGGVRIDVGPHVFVRPDARALVVFANDDTETLGVFALSVGFRF